MTDKYRGKPDDRVYGGNDADITYNVKRCIHAKYCVTRLAEVFDTDKRPWIQANHASADRVAETVSQCPSGALHYTRKDDGAQESPADMNCIILRKDGYLQLVGNLRIYGATVEIDHEVRATLCRCGTSKNKPFCDNSHIESGFSAPEPEAIRIDKDDEIGTLDVLSITVHPDGPYEVIGRFQIENDQNEVIHTGSKTWLCRCGGSRNKPFCDSSHKKNGFNAE